MTWAAAWRAGVCGTSMLVAGWPGARFDGPRAESRLVRDCTGSSRARGVLSLRLSCFSSSVRVLAPPAVLVAAAAWLAFEARRWYYNLVVLVARRPLLVNSQNLAYRPPQAFAGAKSVESTRERCMKSLYIYIYILYGLGVIQTS